MNKFVKYGLIAVAVIGILAAIVYFLKQNSTPKKIFETESAERKDIVNKVIVTGKVIPEDEINIKPQITGIIDKIYLEEGDEVKSGELIAVIKVVPNEQSLYQAKGRVNKAKVALSNAELDFNRNKD